jgi:ABC-type dipeptide/oligopeptide/nickel transport system permease component
MLRYALQRLLSMIPLLLGVSLLVFSMIHLTPGDPVRLMLGEDASREDIDRIRHELGLDRPLPQQFASYIGRLVKLDLGTSLRSRQPVAQELLGRARPSLELALSAMVVATVLGVLLGVVAALKKGTWIDTAAMVTAVTGVSAPTFWVGLIFILVFAVRLNWFPSSGRGTFAHLVLPAMTLGVHYAASIARVTRASMLDVIGEDYVRTASAKGLPDRRVVIHHALRNALLPIVTLIGLQLGALLGGSVVVETVFAWPGVGRLTIDAIRHRDYPVIQAAILFMATAFALVNLAIDLLYARLDPRIEYS